MTREEALAYLTGEPLTPERAIEFARVRGYEPLTSRERFEFQIRLDTMFMPFSVLRAAANATLGRDVALSEFSAPGCAKLMAELKAKES